MRDSLTRRASMLRPWLATLMAVLCWIAMSGCKERPPKAPGETDILVAEVEIIPWNADAELALPHGALFDRLGMRPGSLILTDRTYSTFREGEDRRRIEAFWHQFGYFDVEVSPAEVTFPDNEAHVVFRVRENTRYAMAAPRLLHAPDEEKETLEDLIVFHDGSTSIDLERFRKSRIDMQEHLKRAGFGHANVYSRAYVDKTNKKIHFYYFADAGPKTKIASIRVDGNVKIPAADVIDRSGLEVGDPYGEGLRDSVPRDLLDTGAYAAAYVRVDTDTKFIAPGTAPDSGGELRDEQIDAQGNLVPRKLPEGVNVTIHVVEAPSQTLRVRAGFEIDPARADTTLGATLWLRNLFAPLHHLVLEGRVGYGWLFGTPVSEPSGVYGEALVRSLHHGVLGRLGDLRITARYRSDLFPSAFLHDVGGGPGVRTTIDKALFFDLDIFAVYQRAIDFGPFSPAARDELSLPNDDETYGPELSTSFIWDGRDDPVEALRGHLLSLRARFMPGDPIATHRYLNLAPDARLFLPLADMLGVGLRASGEWAFLGDEEVGVPLGARLFGGGAYGLRGFGRQLFSPELPVCFVTPGAAPAFCRDVAVGGLSLVETSAELRFLPPLAPYGAVAFVDFGGASADLNPFALGPSLAAGLGVRLRLWYLPAAIDVSYRILEEGEVQDLDDSPFHVFFRIGEAF